MKVFVQMVKSLKNGRHLNGKNNLKFFFLILLIKYFSIITSIKNNTDKVQIDLSRIPSFEKILGALEGQLLDGRIFQVKQQTFIFPEKNSISFRIVLNKYLIQVLLLQKILYYKKNLHL